MRKNGNIDLLYRPDIWPWSSLESLIHLHGNHLGQNSSFCFHGELRLGNTCRFHTPEKFTDRFRDSKDLHMSKHGSSWKTHKFRRPSMVRECQVRGKPVHDR